MYQLTAKEALFCHLGDLAFLLKEYDQAIQFYKVLIEEVKVTPFFNKL